MASCSESFFESSGHIPKTSRERIAVDEEEEAAQIKWAAIERLPTYNRVRNSIFKDVVVEAAGSTQIQSHLQQVDVTNIPLETRKLLVERLVGLTAQDNEHFLQKLHHRLQRVGIILPEIEIRFEKLNISSRAYLGSRALPTLVNWTLNILEDALVSFRLRKTKKKTQRILRNVSGVIKPGRMVLLLGPPASGKTTLLLALAGRFNKTLKVDGEVKYNGHAMSDFVPHKTATYISQHDVHMGEMTVREIFDFSARCQGVGSRYDVLSELSRREKQLGVKPDLDIDVFMKAIAMEGQKTSMMTEYVLKALGLEPCAEKMVGDQMRRGISGGEKKRVTIGEMIVGGDCKAFLLDEISTGLDSSTAYRIIRCFYHFVHIMKVTMVVSLLQPAPETFQLFDDLILLSEGYIVYQGPREFVLGFFETMGFKCPERKAVADFLQELISRKDQEQYWCTSSGKPYRYVSAKEFAEAFKSFPVGADLISELSIPYDKAKCHPAALSKEKYGLSKIGLFRACFDRQLLLMKRNAFIHIFKFLQITSVAMIAMTVYFRTNMHPGNLEDASLYIGALFLGLVMNLFNGLSGIATTIEKLPVFYKQRDFMFYPAWAYSLPIFITEIPLSLIESTAWVSLTYYTIDFAPAPKRFFRHFFLLVALHQTGLALFRLIAAVARNIIIANTFGAFVLLITFVLGGFIISRGQ